MPSSALAAAFRIIDDRFPEAVEMVRALVRVPSDNPPGDCAPHARATQAALERLGFAVEAHPVPDDVVRAHGMISATNLIVRHRFGPGPTIAFNIHGDVVAPGLGWTTDPYGGEIRDGWLYGRGAAVSKSDFATYGFALRALIDAGVPLAGAVELHCTWDEEIGGAIGPARILEQGLSKPDYAVCAAFSYAVIAAHNGCLHLEVTVRGKSAHAAWSETGHDALEAATTLLQAIYAYRARLKTITSRHEGLTHPSCVVGLISGGINTNVVPDEVTFRLDRRILPDEDVEAAEAELVGLIRRTAAPLPGIAVEVKRIMLAKPFVPIAGADRLAAAFTRNATAILGEPVETIAVPLYTDARHYAARGIPTVMYGAGPKNPLDANGHRADERVPVETIRLAAKVTAAAVAELLAV